jgi:uncharacterized protein YqhQ
MKDIFATIYETWFQLYDSQFQLIFDTLYNDGGYVMFGLLFILVSLILWVLFYYVWNYPYGKFWHWLVWLIVTFIIVAGTTYGIANNEIFVSNNKVLINALADPESGYEQFAKTLPIKYALFNGILTTGLGFIYSLILKQFSKIQIHLPF